MAGSLWMSGPLPTGGDLFCTLCTMLYKGRANQTEKVSDLQNLVNGLSEDEWRKVSIDGDFLPGLDMPEPAVAMFISPIIQQIVGQLMGLPQGMVPPPLPVRLCWTHITGLQLKPGGVVVPASADQMPADTRGAVDLSRRRAGG